MPMLRPALAAGLAVLLTLFFVVTGRPIYGHTEYAGALSQLGAAAGRFAPGRDILLMRGGGPIWAEARDVPDLVATPLRFAYGLDAFTVKSSQPGAYAADLAAQVARWQSQGRSVYLLLSASGAGFALPGYRLEPAGDVGLDLPEFEALTDQKPQNVSRLSLPFRVYRAVPAAPGVLGGAPLPLTPSDFAAQLAGFYRPELAAGGAAYAWTNGEGLLRLPWPANAAAQTVTLALSPGQRPAQLGPGRVCLSAQPEDGVWPKLAGAPLELGCFELSAGPSDYPLRLDPAALPPTASGTLLLRIVSEPWVPAAEDPRQTDRRAVGVQFLGLR
jgi:hypothetical protein